LIDAAGLTNIDEYVNLLSSELNKRNLGLQEILITHWHRDHTEGVQSILKTINKEPIRVSKYKLEGRLEADLVTKYNFIGDNEEFRTDGATIRAVYTPGHTADHISYYLKEENALFSGDCILGETTANFEDLFTYMNSLRKILDQFKPDIIYPGHGPVVKDGIDRIQAYINHRNKRNEQIMATLRESNQALDEFEIVKIVYVVSF
jgi:glyoxylase-like metal-dependent hydrolase (beta-lactamase superfamily II)